MLKISSSVVLLLFGIAGCGGELVSTSEVQAEKLPIDESTDKSQREKKSPQEKKKPEESIDRNDPEERFPISAMRHMGKVLIAQTSDDGKKVLFTWDNRLCEGSLVMPKDAGEITGLRIGRYLSNSGFALAIETKPANSKERFYFWSLGGISPEKETVGTHDPVLFLKSKIDYEISGVHNSYADSLYILLVKHRRFKGTEQQVDGYVFIHNCPFWGTPGGTLYPLSQKEGKAVGYPGEKEQPEQKR